MKKLIAILLCLPLLFTTCKKEEEEPTNTGNNGLTYVPDDNFEQELINLGYDIGPLDNYVYTSMINTVTHLNVNNKNISDLTGIEDFIALTELNCIWNALTSLDVSYNTALTHLRCSYNQYPTSLDVSNNTALILLECYSNNLTSLDVSQNTALIELVSYSNQLTSLDVSNNSALTYLICGNNQLTTLDVRNGNNTNHIDFICNNNPLLYCIDVDNAAWSTANWTVGNNNIDPHHYFSEQCP